MKSIEELRKIAEAAPKGITCRYVTEGGELALFWTNPWSGNEEKIATFWWPTHPIEATKQVEDGFEAIAEIACLPILELLARLKRAEAVVEAAKEWRKQTGPTSNEAGCSCTGCSLCRAIDALDSAGGA